MGELSWGSGDGNGSLDAGKVRGGVIKRKGIRGNCARFRDKDGKRRAEDGGEYGETEGEWMTVGAETCKKAWRCMKVGNSQCKKCKKRRGELKKRYGDK